MSGRIALAPEGVYRTVLGEGPLAGLPALLVRFGGCSVGCGGCDADYSVASRVEPAEFAELLARRLYGAVEWCWLSGGEPTDRDLTPCVLAARRLGLKVALATAGVRAIDRALFDFVSVSPHRLDASWVLRRGDALNVVPGLNGLKLSDLAGVDVSGFPPGRRYVTPLADREGRPANLGECLDFVMAHPGWRLGAQAHRWWRLP